MVFAFDGNILNKGYKYVVCIYVWSFPCITVQRLRPWHQPLFYPVSATKNKVNTHRIFANWFVFLLQRRHSFVYIYPPHSPGRRISIAHHLLLSLCFLFAHPSSNQIFFLRNKHIVLGLSPLLITSKTLLYLNPS
jgi:hypothetical protein